MSHKMGYCIALFVLCGYLRKGPSSRTMFWGKASNTQMVHLHATWFTFP